MVKLLLLLGISLLLAGCEQLAERAGLVDPDAKPLSDGESRAVGGGCRHAGRAIEDCYALNPRAMKDGVFAGWKEMNDYMKENGLSVVKPEIAGRKRGAHADDEEALAAKKAEQPKETDKEDVKKAGSKDLADDKPGNKTADKTNDKTPDKQSAKLDDKHTAKAEPKHDVPVAHADTHVE